VDGTARAPGDPHHRRLPGVSSPIRRLTLSCTAWYLDITKAGNSGTTVQRFNSSSGNPHFNSKFKVAGLYVTTWPLIFS
jgi:hypothetical protein